MSKGSLVPVPVAPPSRKRLRRGPLVLLSLALLVPAAYLAATKMNAPEPRAQYAALKSESESLRKEQPPEPPLVTGSVSATANVPLPPPRPATDQSVAHLPILLPQKTSPATPSLPSPNGWPSNTPTASTAGIEGTIVRHINRDIDGSDYLVLRNADLNGCQSQCRSDARCQAFTFNTWEKICFLKSSANVMRIEPRGISGVRATASLRPAVRPPTIERVPGRQFPEAPYRVTFQTNYDACAWQCTAEEQCLGFNYRRSDGFCGFFAGLAKSIPAYGTDVGMKWQPPYDPTAPTRRRAVHPWRDMPSEAAIFFDSVIRQIAR